MLKLLWTYLPLIGSLSAFVLCGRDRMLAGATIAANLAFGCLFDRAVGELNAWTAVGYGAIDYITAIVLFLLGERRCALLFCFNVAVHAVCALLIHTLADPSDYEQALALYRVELAYGWLTFVLSCLATVIFVGGGRGGGRRIRLGRVVPASRLGLAWRKDLAFREGRD